MLQRIRDYTHGWIATLIISILVLSFAVWGIHSYLSGANSNSNNVALVNGVAITTHELSSAYERLHKQIANQIRPTVLSLADDADIKQRALNSLVSMEILRQNAEINHFAIGNQQVEIFLKNLPDLQVHGQLSNNRLQQLLANTLLTAPELINLLKTTLVIEQPRLGLLLSSFALPNEITESAALINQKRDISYFTVPESQVAKQVLAKLTESALMDYYAKHRADYKTPEKISVNYIELSLKDVIQTIHPAEEAIRNYYAENIITFSSPAQWQLHEIKVPLLADANNQDRTQAQTLLQEIANQLQHQSLDRVAAHYSSRVILTKLPWLTLKNIPSAYQEAVLPLTKDGQMTVPIQTKTGSVLLYVTHYKPAQPLPYEKVKARVIKDLINQQAIEKFNDLKEKLANLTYENASSLEPAAIELGLKIQSSQLFTAQQGAVDDLSLHPKIREVAFSKDVLHLDNNSELLALTPDTWVVLRKKTYMAASVLPYHSVKESVRTALSQVLTETEMLALANQVVTKLNAGAAADTIANDYHLLWFRHKLIERHTMGIDPAILYLAFRLPAKEEGAKPFYSAIKMAKGYAIVSVNKTLAGAIKNKAQYVAFAEQAQDSLGLLEYELYKQSLINNATVSMTRTANDDDNTQMS